MTDSSKQTTTNQAPAQHDSARRAPCRTASRHAAVAASMVALTSAALAPQLSAAPLARADHTVSVDAVCDDYRPGYVPVMAVGTLGELICVAPGYINLLPGLNDSSEGRVKPGNLPGLPSGSYRVNPFDPFSDWVIPG
jgi:hypothetical protein